MHLGIFGNSHSYSDLVCLVAFMNKVLCNIEDLEVFFSSKNVNLNKQIFFSLSSLLFSSLLQFPFHQWKQILLSLKYILTTASPPYTLLSFSHLTHYQDPHRSVSLQKRAGHQETAIKRDKTVYNKNNKSPHTDAEQGNPVTEKKSQEQAK